MEKTAVLAITKNGVVIGQNLKKFFPDFEIFAPLKLSNGSGDIAWYAESTSEKIVRLFKDNNALICLFLVGGSD